MKSNLLRPLSRSEVASAARTSSSNSGALTLPMASVYQWILDVTVIAGVDTTLDVYIDTTPDNGTTYYSTGPAFRQFTTSGGTGVDIIRVQPAQGRAEGGQEWLAWSTTNRGPFTPNIILTRKYRISWTFGGGAAGGTVTFQVWLLAQPVGRSGGL